jgi:hypothetical protein
MCGLRLLASSADQPMRNPVGNNCKSPTRSHSHQRLGVGAYPPGGRVGLLNFVWTQASVVLTVVVVGRGVAVSAAKSTATHYTPLDQHFSLYKLSPQPLLCVFQ